VTVSPRATCLLVLVGGPIASGKSSVARALAEILTRRQMAAAAIDLDVIYEMLDADGPKDDADTWSRARRLAARMIDALLCDGIEAVIVEGDLLLEEERRELTSALEAQPTLLAVTVRVPLETALERVAADPSRGRSRDTTFLTEHYGSLAETLDSRPDGELVLDTAGLTPAQAAERVVAELEAIQGLPRD
jgi:adenylylsulfate kinase-like enzyme